MGTWGVGIFANDTASDVRAEFRELIESGMDPGAATDRMLKTWHETRGDSDDATCFWTALAATQVALGRLQAQVRDQTIQIIDRGGDLHMWDGEPERRKRQAVLSKLKDQLLGPQKSPTRVRPPTQIPSPVQAGQTIGLRLPDGREALLRVMVVNSFRYGQYPIVEMVDSRGRAYTYDHSTQGRIPARYSVIVGRRKDLPEPDQWRVVKEEPARPGEAGTQPWSGTNWKGLATLCQRLLDDPAAQPPKGLFDRFRS